MTAITTNLPPISSLDCYIRAVQTIALLDEETERALATKVAKGNDREAAQGLVLPHLRFVVKIARSYLGYGLPLADLIQEGNVGLLKAVRRFTPDGGARLASYAAYWIRAEIHDFVLRNLRIVRIATTKAQRKLFFRLRSLIAPEAAGRALNHDEAKEIADTLEVSPAEVHEMRQRLNAHDISLDSPISSTNDESNYAALYVPVDYTSNPEMLLEQSDSKEHMTAALAQSIKALPARSRDIIESRWCGEHKSTLRELAVKHGVSVERVRQIEKQALQKVRETLS